MQSRDREQVREAGVAEPFEDRFVDSAAQSRQQRGRHPRPLPPHRVIGAPLGHGGLDAPGDGQPPRRQALFDAARRRGGAGASRAAQGIAHRTDALEIEGAGKVEPARRRRARRRHQHRAQGDRAPGRRGPSRADVDAHALRSFCRRDPLDLPHRDDDPPADRPRLHRKHPAANLGRPVLIGQDGCGDQCRAKARGRHAGGDDGDGDQQNGNREVPARHPRGDHGRRGDPRRQPGRRFHGQREIDPDAESEPHRNPQHPAMPLLGECADQQAGQIGQTVLPLPRAGRPTSAGPTDKPSPGRRQTKDSVWT